MRSEFYLGKKLTVIMVIIISFFTVQYSYSQTYCTPVINNTGSSWGIGITNVTIGSTINNTTTADNVNPPFLHDYTSMVVSAKPCTIVTFSLSPGTGNQSNMSIWIDWNKDGTFNTTGNEFIYNSGAKLPGQTVSGSFKVPAGLAPGNYRIRVGADFTNPPSPCGPHTYGEHEDYTFTVLAQGTATVDVAMNSIVAPATFAIGNNTLVVDYKSAGYTVINTVDIGYKVDNGTAVTISGYTIPGGLDMCGTNLAQYTFSVQLNLTAGSHILKIWVNNPNSTYPDANITNDTLTKNIYTALSGTLIIDKKGTGNYTTFASAVTALQAGGVNGAVVYIVKPGTYSERVVIPQIIGASATNTITFDGQNADSVLLTYAGTATTSRATVVLNGADYVTFTNMTIQNNGATYQTVVMLTNFANYNTFKNCKLICTGNSSSNFFVIGIWRSEAAVSTGVYDPASYNIFQDNLISGGWYGTYLYGGDNSNWDYGNQFIRNDFNNQNRYGMYNNNQWGMTISNNYIHNMVATDGYGIYNYWSQMNTIDGNIINPSQYGIYLYYENVNNTGNRTRVINNTICNFKNTSQQIGIMLFWYGGNMDILHNSIWVNGNAPFNAGSSYLYAAIYLNYFMTNATIKNNILTSTGTTLLLSGMGISSAPTIQCDYNSYYYPNSTSDKFSWFTSTTTAQYHSNLFQFQLNTNFISITHDVNSFENVNPNFISSTDLHISPFLAPLYGKFVGVGKDIDGNARCTMSPTIGADESTYPYPAPNTDFSYPDTIYMANLADFLSMSSKTIPYKYKWYINGTSNPGDTLHDISRTFATAGTYTVKSIITGCSSKDSTSHTFDVIAPVRAPKAQFSTNSNVVTIFDPINLKDLSRFGPDTWTWTITPDLFYNSLTGLLEPTYSFSGTSSINTQNPTLFFLAPGSFTISLTVSNAFGTDSTIKKDYIIVMPDLSICAGEYVSNNNYGKLYDDGGKLTNYSNNLSCKFLITPCSPKLKLIVRSFNLAAGDYLKLYDGKDANGIKMYNATTSPNGFTGTIAPNTTFKSTTGKFFIEFNTDAATTAPGFELEWVADSAVNTPPVASFMVPDTICLDKTYLFKNTSTGYGNKYYWDLNKDGIPDNQPYEEDITAYYSVPFSDTVSLAVENCGGVDTFYKIVTADVPNYAPKVGFYVNNTVPNINTDIIKLYDTSYRCVDYWRWEITPATFTFKNSTNKNSSTPEVTFTSVGCYDIKLVAGANGKLDSLTKNCYINALSYCIPTINTFMSDIGISNVKIGTINNPSTITSTAYTNYSSTSSTNLIRGHAVTIEVKRNTSFNYMTIAVWIDYNMNGNFNDSGERVAYTPSSSSLSWTANFTVPYTARLGATRMRISTNIANKQNLACGTNKNGEFEDYKVILVNDQDKPVITLIGPDTVIVEKWNRYVEKGATATDLTQGDLSSSIIITGFVDSSIFGIYYKKYNVTDIAGNKAVEVTRVIVVSADKTPPIITLVGGDTIIEVFGTPAYTEPGYSAIDPPLNTNYTSSVVVTGSVDQTKLGVYPITYYVVDVDGNPAIKIRKVTVADTKPPVIVLNGNDTIKIDVNTPYTDPGYSVSDNYWKNLVVDVTGTVNTAKTGTYLLHYSCTDSSANVSALLIRTVIVQDTTKPVIKLIGMDTITIEAGTDYLDPGATVSDNYCLYSNKPTFTGSVNIHLLGQYILTYDITDCEGNVAKSMKRIVNVVDTKGPDIALIGHAEYELIRWQKFVEDGYTVSDSYWPLSQITVDTLGDYVSTNIPGMYYIQYRATDGSGNVSYSKKRIIYVTEFNGIDDKTGEKAYLIAYPNPAKSMVKIHISLDQLQPVSLVIYDVFGNEIQKIYTGNLSKRVFDLDVSAYSKGMYFIKLQTRDKQLLQKLIIN